MNADDIRAYVVRWNNKFPCDRWWRQKHGVAFGSPEHREISFIDQYFEFIEDMMFSELQEERKKANEYIPNEGDFMKVVEPPEDETMEDFVKRCRREFGIKPKE